MNRILLDEITTADIERDKRYMVVVYNENSKTSEYRFAVYYYESPSDMHLWEFEDGSSIEVGDEYAIFKEPINVDVIDM